MSKYPIELQGCNGGGCIFQDNSKGMHTGGCRCEKELRRHPEGLKAVRMIRALRNEQDHLEKAIADLSQYFKSGNSVPVDRATIKADDFWRIVGS